MLFTSIFIMEDDMTHEFESGFFVRRPAWHKLGTVVQTAPCIEDAIKLAGLDWEVQEQALWLDTPEGHFRAVPSHKALIRETDRYLLGVVGINYKALPNIQAFRFFNPFIEQGYVQLETAGSLKKGKRVWVLAKVRGAQAEIVPGDEVNGYLLLSNSHDGSQAVRVQFTTVRVVCWNTLSSAERKGDSKLESCLKVRHTANIEAGLEAVQKAVDVTNRTFSASVEAYQALARKRITIAGLKEYVREVMRYDGFGLTSGMPMCWDVIEQAYESGPGSNIEGVRGTYWGAYNAITDWLDHTRGKGDDSRLDSMWFGSGKAIADRALAVGLQH
jgi:phage/plasmid-like protein (TIGR03299 family)